MRKKLLALLLCLSMLLGMTATVFAAEAEAEEPVEIAADVFSNLAGKIEVGGYYYDNRFYIPSDAIYDLTGAEIMEEDADHIKFALYHEYIYATVYADDEDIPTLVRDGKLYVSAYEFLTFLGAEVGFGESEKSPIHMAVSMPYTVLDLIAEVNKFGGYIFSWSEADSGWVDPEDLQYLAALDTVFFGYNSNLMSYLLPGVASDTESAIYADVLMEVLRNEGVERIDSEPREVKLFGAWSDSLNLPMTWMSEIMDWVEEDSFSSTYHSALSGGLTAAGVTVNVAGDYLNALESAKQFANMTMTQKTMLNKTLNQISRSSQLYKDNNRFLDTAKEVSGLIGDRYAAEEKAAWSGLSSLLANVGTAALSSSNIITLAWDTMTGIAKIDPLIGSVLEAEEKITFATGADTVQWMAVDLYREDMERLNGGHDFAADSKKTATLEEIRYDIILMLKGALTARELLIDTDWLKEASEAEMDEMADLTALLLNKAQNARILEVGSAETLDEDISWMKNLAGSGAMGYVVNAGGYTYYWKYSAASFYSYGISGFSKQAADNELMRIDGEGNIEAVMKLNSYGEFAIVGNSLLFYRSAEGYICSVPLKGGEATVWGKGYLQCVSANGNCVVYTSTAGELMTVFVRDNSQRTIGADLSYVAYHNGRIYVSRSAENADAQAGKVELYSISPDGTDLVHLYTTEPDLYDFYDGMSYAQIAQMRFTDEYVYFAYGSVGGSGMFYQGGRIVRVKYDGTDGKVVAGKNELVGAEFSINEDGTLNTVTGDAVYELLFTDNRTCDAEDGTIFCYDERGGRINVAYGGDYPGMGDHLAGMFDDSGCAVLLDFAEIVNGKAYYLCHLAVPNTDVMNWREAYARDKTVMYCKDLSTEEVTVLYEIN